MNIKEVTVRGIDMDLQEMLQTLADKLKAEGCTGCAYIDTPEWKNPCAQCKRACKDYWRKPKGRKDRFEAEEGAAQE